jgi:hypothetical protein
MFIQNSESRRELIASTTQECVEAQNKNRNLDRVPVVDQMGRLTGPRRRFDQLPPDPCACGVGGDVEVRQLSAAVADEEDDVEDVVADRLDDEEVGRPDAR